MSKNKRIINFYKILRLDELNFIFLILSILAVSIGSCSSRSQRTYEALRQNKKDNRNIGLDFLIKDTLSLNKYLIHFIDVGQGESTLIQTPDKIVLIDAGERNGIAAGYLIQQNISHIDIAIATHPHSDHIGGFLDVFELFTIGELIDPGVVHTTLTFERYLTQIFELDIPFIIGRKGMKRELGEGAFLEILYPEEPSDQNLNAASIVVKLTLGDFSALFTGDIERGSEIELLKEKEKLKSNLLKVAHHGGATSSQTAFLNEVKPEVAVIFCGQNNAFGFPAMEVISRLNHFNTKVFRTDLHGHIILSTDGQDFSITSVRRSQLQ